MPDKEVPVKDFLEEHRRLKEEKLATPSQQPPSPAAQPPPQKPAAYSTPPPPAPSQPPPPPQSAVSQPATQTSLLRVEPEPQAQQLSFVQLVEQLRSLGYDVQPLESLKGFADKLDAEEQRLMKEISERQKRLETVRAARRLLRVLGL